MSSIVGKLPSGANTTDQVQSLQLDVIYLNSLLSSKTDVSVTTSLLSEKAPINNPAFTGVVDLPSTTQYNGTNLNTLLSTGGGGGGGDLSQKADLTYVDSQLEEKAPINNPTLTGTVSLPSSTNYNGTNLNELLSGVGALKADLTYVNTELANKADISSLGEKAPINNPTLTGIVSLPLTTNYNGTNLNTLLEGVGGTDLSLKADLTYVDSQLANKAPINNATLTGLVSLPYTTKYNGTDLHELFTGGDAVLTDPTTETSYILSVANTISLKLINTAMSGMMSVIDVIKSNVASAIQASQPIGTIIQYGGSTTPNGYIVCDGRTLSRSEYVKLFNAIGVAWGIGNGSTTFNIPDLRDRFLRGQGTRAGVVSSIQEDTLKSHTHTGSSADAGGHSHSASTGTAGNHSHSGNTTENGGHDNYAFAVNPQSQGFGGSTGWAYNRNAVNDGDQYVNTIGNHGHNLNINSSGNHSHSVTINGVANHSHSISITATGGTETRPMCATVLFAIKF